MPERPSKKKPKDADPAGEQPAAKADERNLVVVDEDFEQADVEDKLWLFWERNKAFIILAIVVAVGGVVGVQGYRAWNEHRVESMKQSFVQAEDTEAKISFAESHPDKPLAAISLMEAAREPFDAGDYAEAAELYERAIEPAKGSALAGAPSLRAGMAWIRAGEGTKGRELLSSIIDDSGVLGSYRAEAAYHLGILELTDGNYTEAASLFNMLQEMESAGIWARQALSQLETNPELQEAAAQAAGESAEVELSLPGADE